MTDLLTMLQSALCDGRPYREVLAELAQDPRFRQRFEQEFPAQAGLLDASMDRRRFLALMGASVALAGAAACTRQPLEKIVPYVKAPEEILPGKPLYYATALPLSGYGRGAIATSTMGRPIKIEGNPDHPASLGATDVFMQADILDLYDPDRSQAVMQGGLISTWDSFRATLQDALDGQLGQHGAGLRILTETVTSPTLARQLLGLLAQFPAARWHVYEPVSRDAMHQATRQAFGQAADPLYRLERAQVIVSFGADFLGSLPGQLRYAREFMANRQLTMLGPGAMNRLYAIESMPSLPGASADHRIVARPSEMGSYVHALAQSLGLVPAGRTDLSAAQTRMVSAMAQDLMAHQGNSLVLVDEQQPAEVQALGFAINARLGNLGQTLDLIDPVQVVPPDHAGSMESLAELTAEMQAGKVQLLVILGGNPVYMAPADVPFGPSLGRVPLKLHLGRYDDETSALCDWHLPQNHVLESWSDVRAFDGTITIQQPLIAPLYQGKSSLELLAMLAGQFDRSDHDLLKAYWRTQHKGPAFEVFWQQSLNVGTVAGSAPAARQLALLSGFIWPVPVQAPTQGLELIFAPDPCVWDGRYANNAWLQELPRPITQLTWGNAALVSPATAAQLGVGRGDLVELEYRGRTLQAPIFLVAGHPDGALTAHLGYGRTRSGEVGTGVGFDAYALRFADAPGFATGVRLRKVGGTEAMASTQNHHRMEGRHLARSGTMAAFLADPGFVDAMDTLKGPLPSLYPPYKDTGYAWGMAIDLNTCIGCNACIIACQAENNIPVVGKEEVLRDREMHWLRVDAYDTGDAGNPERIFQPVPCMQCEDAPCELVCPVEATLHDDEGLNEMIYNRCVGTRYCSNNCPYKVRRFNFFQYVPDTQSLKLQRNPNVTVRTRGVMEKCTYCIQRINAARIPAQEHDRPIRDGEVVTACQQACPTRAIVFGDLNDPRSAVSLRKASPLNYALLKELNTRPRTTYLAKLRNPNPELAT